jgi:hypothetical protein
MHRTRAPHRPLVIYALARPAIAEIRRGQCPDGADHLGSRRDQARRRHGRDSRLTPAGAAPDGGYAAAAGGEHERAVQRLAADRLRPTSEFT